MENKISIYTKLLAVQQELEPIMKTKDNPFYKSKYADINSFIEMVKPVLNKNKLILLQPLTDLNGNIALKSILADAETGETIEDVMPMVLKDNDPQKVGSAVSYYRRYALQSLLLIQAEDDDGNATKQKPVEKPVAKPVSAKQKIVTLLKKLSYNTETKPAVENAVLSLTSLELVETNFDEIVSRLEVLVNEQK